MLKIPIIILLLVLPILYVNQSIAEHSNNEIFTVGVPSHGSSIVYVYVEGLAEVYKKLGYTLEIRSAPARRVVLEANRGTIDGVMLSPTIIENHAFNLLRINVPMATADMMAISLSTKSDIKSIEDLKQYRVGYVLGYATTGSMLHNLNAEPIPSMNLLFSMIAKGRLDVALVLRREAYRYVDKHPRFSHLKMHETPMLSVVLYHHLNVKHQSIKDRVESIMADYWASGKVQQQVELLTPRSPFTPH